MVSSSALPDDPPEGPPGDVDGERPAAPGQLPRPPARSATTRWAARLGAALTTVAALGLLFALHQYWITDLRAALEQRELRTAVGATDPAGSAGRTTVTGGPGTSPARTRETGALGVLQIPDLDLDVVVLDTATRSALQRGPGHLVGTSRPSDPGNAVVAGHRTTWGAPFAHLDRLRPGDTVQWSDARGSARYRVVAPSGASPVTSSGEDQRGGAPDAVNGPGHRIVRPDDASVTDQDATVDRLTLVTCHPRFSAAQRLVVVAERIDVPVGGAAGGRTVTDDRRGRPTAGAAAGSAAPPLLGLGETAPPRWYEVVLPGGVALLVWAWSGVLAGSAPGRPRWRVAVRRTGWRLLGATLAAAPLLVTFDRLAGVLPAGR
ncbi:MAG: sortase domain-containing protein [Angustibacter sp.]